MKNKTLRRQFNIQMLLTLIAIVLVSGIIQIYLISNQIDRNINSEAGMISESIKQGINETELAAAEIEHQIDLKLESMAIRAGEHIVGLGKPVTEITQLELINIVDQVGLGGLTLFAHQENDVVGIQSTDPAEIGFSFKQISPEAYQAMVDQINGKRISGEVAANSSYVGDNIGILYTAQSGSHGDEPAYFKYAYYHIPGTDFLISPFIEASEIHNFIEKVGPESWISKVLDENEYAKEIAVLDPRVYADPSLAEKLYPPLKKVVNGAYELVNDKDNEILIDMATNPTEYSYLDTTNEGEFHKVFLPLNEDYVIYIALDYKKMSTPLYNISLIVLVFSFASLVALFMITTRFFSKIYANIAKIIDQIKALEKGDFTSLSYINDGGELSDLSKTANKMTETLNRVIGETRDQANETERLAYMLESSADNSVEKVYTMSMETTIASRESLAEIEEFLNQVEDTLKPIDNNKAQEVLSRIDNMRQLSKDRSKITTDMTITLADLLKSLQGQSESLSKISKKLLKNMEQFILK
ncbi:methyl-accepting chemotaxis protein [Bacillus sp. Marseille-P3661]|uniref:methyl-accepting chemotaxis protein n=1 Tax=Bacillus sp. Marseille-P3661 TaxID=1936234 RepID=UPI000C830646|nr:methyl-accepting chemotaxis protein [Bacillus sp. Marseille-P3661]